MISQLPDPEIRVGTRPILVVRVATAPCLSLIHGPFQTEPKACSAHSSSRKFVPTLQFLAKFIDELSRRDLRSAQFNATCQSLSARRHRGPQAPAQRPDERVNREVIAPRT